MEQFNDIDNYIALSDLINGQENNYFLRKLPAPYSENSNKNFSEM